jgi:hypothetical protein
MLSLSVVLLGLLTCHGLPTTNDALVDGMQGMALTESQSNPEINYLFDKLSDLERNKIVSHMDPKSRARLASTSKEAKAWMDERNKEETELIAEVLEGIEDEYGYDINYGDPRHGINRPLSRNLATAIHLAAKHGNWTFYTVWCLWEPKSMPGA